MSGELNNPQLSMSLDSVLGFRWKNQLMYLLRTPLQKTLFLLALATLVFLVPYFVPVGQSISLSYVVGFSNRTALGLFVLGAVAFATLSRGELGAVTRSDRQLPVSHLLCATILTLVVGVLKIRSGFPVGEALFSLNRMQMLASGLRPFRDFEFPYGPLQLYAPFELARLLHLSVESGYAVWWVVEWVLGVGMLWVILRLLDRPMSRRRLVFWALLAWQILSAFLSEGMQYTPVRMIGSAYFLVTVHAAWVRWRRPYLTVLLALAALILELGVSPEQAVGVCTGVAGWFVLLATRRQKIFPPQAAVLLCVGSALLFALANHYGLFLSMFNFAGGAYAFPLLPAPAVLLILFAYIVAACSTMQELRRSHFESMAIPMTLGGFAMLPVAMGRCDFGHLQAAAGAFLFGVGSIESIPTLRRWWSPLIVSVLFLPELFISVAPRIKAHLQPAPTGQAAAKIRSDMQKQQGLPTLDASPLSGRRHTPCAVVYRTPGIVLRYDQTPLSTCLDTGYYAGFIDVFTLADIARKRAELDQAPRRPLLLVDLPLAELMETGEKSTLDMHVQLYPRFLLPRPRNRPVSYEAIIADIQRNYVPDAEPTGAFRIWRPRSTK